jgi:hypothetical protein
LPLNYKKAVMKKLFTLFTILTLAIAAFGQDTLPPKANRTDFSGDGIYLVRNNDSIWKIGGYAGVTVSQVALYQWAPGGTNNFAFLVTGNFYANYHKGKIIWDNSLGAKWGMVANGLIRKRVLARQNLQKNIDVFELKSSFGYEVSKSLYVAARMGFESQFTRSYDYTQTDTVNGRFRRLTISKFGAPAVLTIAPGMTWKPKDWFTMFFSPVGGKMTFVTLDHDGRDTTTLGDGTYTENFYKDVDETRFGLQRGKGFMGELGLELDLLFQKDIVKNVNWKSHLNLFVTYLNKVYNNEIPTYNSTDSTFSKITLAETTKHIPVLKWDNDLVFKINKFLSATLSTRFVFQYNAQLPIDRVNNNTGAKGADGVTDVWIGADGTKQAAVTHKSLQIFEQFGIGLSYKF